MDKNIDESKSIVFDADVIIHFINTNLLLDLFKIFPNRSLILDKVYEELSKNKRTKETIDNLIELGLIEIVSFNQDYQIIKEFAHLQSELMNKGKGESACMAYCKFTKNVIASSNLKDIQNYCKLHNITNLTTLDFVAKAYISDFWSFEKCENFIKCLNEKNHRVPFSTFTEYAKSIGLAIAS